VVRHLAIALALAVGCGADEGPWLIRGTARLPACNEPAAFDLDGSTWFDDGEVTVTSAGCSLPPETTVSVCGLAWEFSQSGADVEILVDGEYRVLGRACGDALHLEGGFWLTVQDERGFCDYEDGVEVTIEREGATLVVSGDQMMGTLAVAERCTATYAVTLHR
jgi:hypothetical protein